MAVNFIHQMNNAMNKFANDERTTPYHRALYFALFFRWNQLRFKDEFSIYRDEILTLSGIRSPTTYHRCLKELQKFGFLTYIPSNSIYKGSKIKMKIFPKKENRNSRNKSKEENSINYTQSYTSEKSNSIYNRLRPTGIQVDQGGPYDEPL